MITGSHHTIEARFKISQYQIKHSSRRGKTITPENIAKMLAGKKPKTLTPKHKEKLLQANVGRKHTPETIQKMRNAKLGKLPTEEQRLKMPIAQKERRAREREEREAKAFKVPEIVVEPEDEYTSQWALF